jgi:hypothetical protein
MPTLLRRVAYVLCFPLLTALLAATLMAWAGSYGTYGARWCYWPKRYRADLGDVDVVSSFLLRTVARRERMGLCPRCGYDLRASAGTCPECGCTDLPR